MPATLSSLKSFWVQGAGRFWNPPNAQKIDAHPHKLPGTQSRMSGGLLILAWEPFTSVRKGRHQSWSSILQIKVLQREWLQTNCSSCYTVSPKPESAHVQNNFLVSGLLESQPAALSSNKVMNRLSYLNFFSGKGSRRGKRKEIFQSAVTEWQDGWLVLTLNKAWGN